MLENLSLYEVSSRVGFRKSFIMHATLTPHVAWQDLVIQAGPSSRFDDVRWPRNFLGSVGNALPPENGERTNIEVTVAQFTGGRGSQRTRVSQIDWWAQHAGLRHLHPRELCAAAQSHLYAHPFLAGAEMPAMRLASLFRCPIGKNPNAPTHMFAPPERDCSGMLSVYWPSAADQRKGSGRSVLVDPVEASDHFLGPWWFAFTSITNT